MMAGMATPTQMDAQGRRPDYSNAVAAGAKAAEPYTQKGSQDAAQKQADDERLRAYSTTDHNFKYHQMQMAADKSDRETQQDVVDSYSTQVQAMNNEFAKGPITDDKGNQVDLWKQQNISGDEVQKLLADSTLNITKDMVVPVGIIEVPNPNGGGTHPQTVFSVYNPSAVIHMSDDIRKDPAMAKLYGVANGTPLPIRVLANMSLDKGSVSLASSGTANWVKGFNNSIPKGSDISPIKDFDLQDAIDSDKTGSIKKLLPWINQYRSGDLVTFFDHMSKNPAVAKDATLAAGVAKLQDAMGLDSEDISKMVQAKADKVLEAKNAELEAKTAANEAAKEKSPVGQLDLEKKQLEVQTLRETIATAQANKAAITPPGFVPVPNANELESAPLQQALAARGVKIPSDFETLYKIAHGEADIATEYTNNPRKGVNLMPRNQATVWASLINPNWQEGDYKANANLTKSIRDTKIGTAGGTLLAAGVASNHLDLLAQAGEALKNNNIQLLNSIAQKYGVETGAKPAVVFRAIGQKLNEEVEKVTAGGTPQVAALKEAHENLNVAESPEQIKGVVNAYVGLMNGRTSEIDAQAYRYTGRHIGVTTNVAKIYNAAGYKVPGQPDINSKPVVRNNEIIGWSSPDGKSMIQVPMYR